ncbi:MAG: site-2 protease family protein [Bryobacteraceae bacterium]|jgi:Zn-dependent protease
MGSETIAMAAIWYVAFLFSLTCHEAAHALVAKIAGDRTAYEAGQGTLNPIPHMRREPIGMIVAPLITYFANGFMLGWASAPYDPRWQRQYPKRAGWMALAGPCANFILVALAIGAVRAGILMGAFSIPESVTFAHMVAATRPGFPEGLAQFLSILFSLNLMLGAFNLLPLPPLDGATAIGLLFSERMALRVAEFTRNPMFSLVGLLIAWRVFGQFSGTIFRFGAALLYPEAYRF